MSVQPAVQTQTAGMVIINTHFPIDSAEGVLLGEALVSHLDYRQALEDLDRREQRLSHDLRQAVDQGISAEALAQTLGVSGEAIVAMIELTDNELAPLPVDHGGLR